jgi:hypothetical protein
MLEVINLACVRDERTLFHGLPYFVLPANRLLLPAYFALLWPA